MKISHVSEDLDQRQMNFGELQQLKKGESEDIIKSCDVNMRVWVESI